MKLVFVIDVSYHMLQRRETTKAEESSTSSYRKSCLLVKKLMELARKLRPDCVIEVYRGWELVPEEQIEESFDKVLTDRTECVGMINMGDLFEQMSQDKSFEPTDKMLVFTTASMFKGDLTHYSPCRTHFVVVQSPDEELCETQLEEFRDITRASMENAFPGLELENKDCKVLISGRMGTNALLKNIVREVYLPENYRLVVGHKHQSFVVNPELHIPSDNLFVVGFTKSIHLMNAPIVSHHEITAIPLINDGMFVERKAKIKRKALLEKWNRKKKRRVDRQTAAENRLKRQQERETFIAQEKEKMKLYGIDLETLGFSLDDPKSNKRKRSSNKSECDDDVINEKPINNDQKDAMEVDEPVKPSTTVEDVKEDKMEVEKEDEKEDDKVVKKSKSKSDKKKTKKKKATPTKKGKSGKKKEEEASGKKEKKPTRRSARKVKVIIEDDSDAMDTDASKPKKKKKLRKKKRIRYPRTVTVTRSVKETETLEDLPKMDKKSIMEALKKKTVSQEHIQTSATKPKIVRDFLRNLKKKKGNRRNAILNRWNAPRQVHLIRLMAEALAAEDKVAICRFGSTNRYCSITGVDEEDGNFTCILNMMPEDLIESEFQPNFDELESANCENDDEKWDLHITAHDEASPSSYYVTTQCWAYEHGLSTDVQKLLRLLRKLPDTLTSFYQDINKFRDHAVMIGVSDILPTIGKIFVTECKAMGEISKIHAGYVAECFENSTEMEKYVEITAPNTNV